ncbi:FkbM family methyltransferase [Niveispirillum sp. SYP-B3756]|uniref:FkbM family methyltransferase n=1 Tax=Niveispirillum sp. SYP-B3756 TaxID=2662178 RepID=UPI001291E6FB|nr:FkbM family methyltransferase [Niveispirillum sp. SYP-B3756]MQP65146.1 FkbM family methyltransferase [Niveispirillum sp. SYP-B3756]
MQATGTFNELAGIDLRIKVVDIGANPIDGRPPYMSMLQKGEAEVVGFEPNPAALSTLNELKGPYETYLPNAVGDGDRHTLRICRAPGMTSLLAPDPAILGLFHGFPAWGEVLAEEEVETVRLDDIAITEGIDMIKIDIQGGELMVLRNAVERLRTVSVIQTEVEFLPLYKGQPLFSEVEMFLRSQGFIFHRFFPINSRVLQPMVVDGLVYSGMSQQVWADGIFVRDFTKLDDYTDRHLLAAASIVHNCYQSFDLSLRLLIEYDRRHGTAFASSYFSKLTPSS